MLTFQFEFAAGFILAYNLVIVKCIVFSAYKVQWSAYI